MVFSNLERTDMGHKKYDEPETRYLERSGRPEAGLIRDLIDNWVSLYPQNERKELVARLRSENDNELYAAFFELYIFILLSQLGYRVTVHPSTSADKSKTPDFLVIGHGEEFFVEATTTNELSYLEIQAEKHLNQALEKINEIKSADFMINIHTKGLPKNALKSANLRDQVRRWIGILNYQEVSGHYEAQEFDKLPEFKYTEQGVNFKITPIPRKRDRGIPDRIIGSRMPEGRWVHSPEAIRKSIENKKSRYGELGKPYLIAIDVFSLSCDVGDVLSAVYGTEKYLIEWDNVSDRTPDPPKPFRDNDGSWSKTKATKVSGLLIVKDLIPWTISQQNLELYINPWARYPYAGKIEQFPHASPKSDGTIEWFDGFTAKQVLGIPEGWPEIE